MKAVPPIEPIKSPVLRVIYGNRDFFPDQLVAESRADIAALFSKLGIKAVQLGKRIPSLAAWRPMATLASAPNCLPNIVRRSWASWSCFRTLGRERRRRRAQDGRAQRAGADPGLSGRPRPAHPSRRRDGFCGKISVCNNRAQARVKFSLTRRHVVRPDDPSFTADLQHLRGLRLGAVGARPGAFNTVRYSEKILERNGINVTTVDLSEFLGKAEKLGASHTGVVAKLADIKGHTPAPGVPEAKLLQMAQLGVVLDD